jgi:hypothetical protein
MPSRPSSSATSTAPAARVVLVGHARALSPLASAWTAGRPPATLSTPIAHALICWRCSAGLAGACCRWPGWWLRQRGAAAPRKLAALTALTLFLTFDLIVFGAFTRLTDSGLGCPDWPGCYGEASPWARKRRDPRRAGRPAHRAGHPRQGLDRDGPPLPGDGGGRADPGDGRARRARPARPLPHSPWWPTLPRWCGSWCRARSASTPSP